MNGVSAQGAVGVRWPVEAPARARRVARRAPAQVLLRAGAAAALALGAAWWHARLEPGVLCPLRLATGVPCPLCGSTTVFVELGSGDLRSAVFANPVTLLATTGLVAAPLGPGRWWWRAPGAARRALLASALAFAWLWQLGRFGFLF